MRPGPCLLLTGALALRALAQTEPARPQILTSFFPAYCLAVNLTEGVAEVQSLDSGGGGPHEFQLAPRHLSSLRSAKLLVVNGLQLEGWLEKTLRALPARERPLVVEMAAGLDAELIRHPTPLKGAQEGQKGETDPPSGSPGVANPHIWLDPQLMAHAVTNVLRALQQVDRAHADRYEQNARAWTQRLMTLDQEMRSRLAQVRGRPFVTLHDAFPYLARRYGLDLVGVIELVPDVEPSPKYLNRLLQVMRERQVRVIFAEPQYSSRLPRQLARDTGTTVAELDTLEVGPRSPGAYEEGLRRNLRVLVERLK